MGTNSNSVNSREDESLHEEQVQCEVINLPLCSWLVPLEMVPYRGLVLASVIGHLVTQW